MNLELVEPHPRRVLEAFRQGDFDGLEILGQADEKAFMAWERVVRCGGALSALDAAIASKHLDREQRQVVVRCVGFNAKNHHDRQTPCDQDMLRKFVKDVPAAEWVGWFNGPVQELFQRYGFFDPEGVFVGDGSYLFVPDNPAYEGSVVAIYHQHDYVQLPLLTFTREVLELQPAARERALRKIRRLEESFLCPVENLRPHCRSP